MEKGFLIARLHTLWSIPTATAAAFFLMSSKFEEQAQQDVGRFSVRDYGGG